MSKHNKKITLKSIKKEKNPGIKKALDNAISNWKTGPGIVILYLYINGDPLNKRYIYLN